MAAGTDNGRHKIAKNEVAAQQAVRAIFGIGWKHIQDSTGVLGPDQAFDPTSLSLFLCLRPVEMEAVPIERKLRRSPRLIKQSNCGLDIRVEANVVEIMRWFHRAVFRLSGRTW